MLHLRRPVLFLVLAALVLALVPAAPAHAELSPEPLIRTVSVYGAGPTPADAQKAAIDQIREDYFIISAVAGPARCSEDEIIGITICLVKVTAQVFPKPALSFP